MEILQEYDVTIQYKPGAHNIVADSLSRRQDYQLNSVSVLQIETGNFGKGYEKDRDFGERGQALTNEKCSGIGEEVSRRVEDDTLLEGGG